VSRAKALLDACVLHPFHLRNLIIQLAFDDVIEARLNLTRSAPDMAAYLDALENQRVTRFVAELREIFAAGR
jgi:hypothetical protein